MSEKKYGNQDERETSRELTAVEQKRLDRFKDISGQMEESGYRRVELTVSIVRANLVAVILLIPLAVIGFGLFLLKNRDRGIDTGISRGPLGMLLFLVLLVALIVVHEAIHGASWAFFTKRGFRDIEFGFMKQYLTPYCTCTIPLTKGQYIFGALMPFLVLGVLPMALGIITGFLPGLLMGIIMADSAAGDLMIVWNILRYRTNAKELVYMDHPTQAGGVIFER